MLLDEVRPLYNLRLGPLVCGAKGALGMYASSTSCSAMSISSCPSLLKRHFWHGVTRRMINHRLHSKRNRAALHLHSHGSIAAQRFRQHPCIIIHTKMYASAFLLDAEITSLQGLATIAYT